MQSDPLVGRHLGAYRIQSLVGEGGMARVYKAQHERLQRVVAIKVILPQSAGLADFQARFEQEAKLIARLQHRNIVTVYDFGESTNMVYLVMQHVEGGTLHDQLRARQPLPPRRAALYALQMARALNHAHQHGIVHRDVKPLNMLVPVKQPNELLLSDFGLAKLFAESSEPPYAASIIGMRGVDQLLSLSLSHTGEIIGTPLYISPEQCLSKPVDARTDIYSLGVVLFEMLTGQLPFHGTNINAILYQHASEPAPSVREINPAVPESLVQITAHALQKAPEQRYQSAKEMARALEAVLAPSVHGYTYSIPLPAPVDAPLVPAPGPMPANMPVSRERDKHRKRLVRIVNLVALLLIAFLLVQVPLHVDILRLLSTMPPRFTQAAPTHVSSCTTTPSSVQAQPFVETFRDDRRGWQPDALQGITPTIKGNIYTLNIANSNRAYFLCPAPTSVGTLPANFTLTAQMVQYLGSPDAFFGLAFHLNSVTEADKVAGYAFVINGRGVCALFKYDPTIPKGYVVLKSQENVPSINNMTNYNTLQVIVQGSHLAFKVNSHPVLLNGTGQEDQRINDPSYTGGQLALLVSGPNTRFTVTHVELNIP